EKFGGVDILINNASAIALTRTLETEMKRYDLMHSINTRGTFLMSKTALPYLKQAKTRTSSTFPLHSSWIPLPSDSRHGHASSGQGADVCRHPAIIADAAYAMLSRRSKEYTGHFAIDEDVLKEEGITDFNKYAVKQGAPLIADYFLPADRLKQFQLTIDDTKSKKRSASREAITKDVVSQEIDKVLKVVESGAERGVGKVNRSISINLKEGNGSITEGKPEKADVEFSCSDEDFLRLFNGELSALVAFSMKKLQIKGNMQKAIALESLMKKLKKN
ncbi:unnamed protein product, partial [Mesorhabditis spiculigera]